MFGGVNLGINFIGFTLWVRANPLIVYSFRRCVA